MAETIYQVLDRIDGAEEEAAPFNGTSLDYLQAIYRDPRQPESRRTRCAIAALPFEHPKLAVTATVDAEGFGARLEAARQRAARVIDHRPDFQKVEVLKETD